MDNNGSHSFILGFHAVFEVHFSGSFRKLSARFVPSSKRDEIVRVVMCGVCKCIGSFLYHYFLTYVGSVAISPLLLYKVNMFFYISDTILCAFWISLGKPQFPCARVDARWGHLDCDEGACDLEGRVPYK